VSTSNSLAFVFFGVVETILILDATIRALWGLAVALVKAVNYRLPPLERCKCSVTLTFRWRQATQAVVTYFRWVLAASLAIGAVGHRDVRLTYRAGNW
jgi:hypothetical protein